MRVVCIVQARMSSTRLPGKVLKSIGGRKMLWYVINRLRLSKKIDHIVVATSKSIEDDAICNFCMSIGVDCFRGSLDNVLERFYKAAKSNRAEVVIRITADCPLVDGKMIDEGLRNFFGGNFDYLSNGIDRTFPRGFDFEIMTFEALTEAFENATEPAEKEHVTPYIYRNHPEKFKIGSFKMTKDKSSYRITVDTKEDLRVVKELIEKYRADKKGYMDIITLLEKHPEILKINSLVEQKTYGQ